MVNGNGQRHGLCRCPPGPADRAGSPPAPEFLRTCFTDEKTDEAVSALRLAWAIELVANEGLDEPLEIGWPQAKAVIRAVPEVAAHAYDGLEILCKRPDGSPTMHPLSSSHSLSLSSVSALVGAGMDT
jgi:hypothetical protein